MPTNSDPEVNGQEPFDEDRRKFLSACGKLAIVTPPALTLLLSTSLNSEAVAKSGGSGGRGHPPRWDGDHGRGLFDWLEKLLDKWF
jgi:hypothetical protein